MTRLEGSDEIYLTGMDSQFYTAVTACAAWAAVIVALIAVWRQNRAAKQLARLQLFMQVAAQWDSTDLVRKRAQIARTLLADRRTLELDDTVLVFFETLAHMARRGVIDRDLTWTTFTVDVCSYWAAVEHYVRHARERFADTGLFMELEWLNKHFLEEGRRQHGVTSSTFGQSTEGVDEFLRWESRRGDDLVHAPPVARIISYTS